MFRGRIHRFGFRTGPVLKERELVASTFDGFLSYDTGIRPVSGLKFGTKTPRAGTCPRCEV